ncbi:MAG: hypothetical protein M1344_01140 [Candidatus Thermoplasmatota archaeon]|jgi:hypothetical protein|nr:hypothetical protein [Candidatus Thermoplasmatota archaeon]
MLYRDIRNRLDMKLVISIQTGTPIEKFSEEHSLFIPASLVISPNSIGSLYFFDRENITNRDADIFLRKSEAREMNGKQTIFASDKVYTQYEFFGRKLLELPSVIIDAHFVEGCCHYFHFRFHSAMIKKISRLLMSEEAPEGMSVKYLGKNESYRDAMDYFAGKIPLNVVTLTSTPPSPELSLDRNPIGTRAWTRETKYLRTDGKIKSIFYLDEALEVIPSGVVEISGKNGIYETETENPLLSEIGKLSGNVIMPALNRTQALLDGRFEIQNVSPNMFNSELMERIKAANQKFPEWNLTLTGIEPV